MILFVLLCECEAWSLNSKEKHSLRAFENRVLRDEVTGEWRRLHNEELYDEYLYPNATRVIKSRRMQHVWGMGEVQTGFWWET